MGNTWKESKTFLRLAFIFFLVNFFGCAGGSPNPVRVYTLEDSSLSCDQIALEAKQKLKSLGIKEEDKSSKNAKNVTFWVLGQIALLPMLGMDVSGKSEVEQKALSRRLERLNELSQKLSC